MKNFKEKIIKNIKENRYVYLTTLVATIIFIIIFTMKSIIPIGKNTMLTVDFYHQYGPFLSELYDKITSFSNLSYTFNIGLGLPLFRNFYNYMSSPFNILILLFDRINILSSFSIIIALKIIVSATTMSYFLKKAFNKNSALTTIFGIAYAFSNYFVAYYWNIMWLDSLIFLPLVILGIKNLIDEGKINLYVISLFLSIIANYFVTYMICIFACIFFITYILFKGKITIKEFFKKSFLFAGASLLAGGLAGFMILPFAKTLSTISATGDAFSFSKTFSFNLLDFIANHFSMVKTVVFSSQEYFLPNVSSGITVFALAIIFFFNGKIKLKHKIMSAILLLILITSFFIVPIDFIWHGFHTPNDLPFRYAFIYAFVLNTIAFYSLSKIDSLKPQYPLIVFVAMFIFLTFIKNRGFITDMAYIINAGLLISSLLLFVLYNLKKIKFLKYIILIFVCFDAIVNIDGNWEINHDNKIFMDNYTEINNLIESIKNGDNNFYRIEKGFNQTLNDGSWYSYNGISIFSSVAYEQMAKAQRNLGLAGNNINSYYYRQNTPVYNSMMGIKYFVDLTSENKIYSEIETDSYHTIHENNKYISMGFAVSNEIKKWNILNDIPIVNQQSFVELATNIKDIFYEVPIEAPKIKFDYSYSEHILNKSETLESITATLHIKPKKDGNLYLYVEGYDVTGYTVNNEYHYIGTNEPFVLDIGYGYKNKTIELYVYLNEQPNSTTKVYCYGMDEEKFDTFYKTTKFNSLQVSEYQNNYIKASINAGENQTVFTSIAYDPGFQVYVDGKEVEAIKIGEVFLGFDIPKGEHTIEITYKIPYLKAGIALSGISCAIFIAINIISKKKKNNQITTNNLEDITILEENQNDNDTIE